jgi:glycosyltransferase involved in cell wall biosynthesis
MPVYNSARYVAEAIESILAQTFGDFEFIIVDDGSTDDSLAILRHYERQDKRIRLITRPNTGIVAALNDGLALARAELVARMDADDVSLPERLGKQRDFMASHPNYVAMSTAYTIMDPDGLDMWDVPVACDHEEIEKELLEARGAGLIHPAVIYRRADVLAAGEYRKEYEWVEDTDLWFRLIERGRVANLPEPLLRKRYHFASVCKARRELQHARGVALIEGVYRRRGVPMPRHLVARCEDKGRQSPVEHYRRWSASAVSAGYFQAARKYARKAAMADPLQRRNFWLLADAYLGPRITRAIKRAYRLVRMPTP